MKGDEVLDLLVLVSIMGGLLLAACLWLEEDLRRVRKKRWEMYERSWSQMLGKEDKKNGS